MGSVSFSGVRLIEPDAGYLASFLEAERESRDAGVYEFSQLPKKYVKNEINFAKYLRRLHNCRYGKGLKRGAVPYTSFWLTDETTATFIGQANIRHYLTEDLATFGGHIGYAIRPGMWGRGYGTLQLSLLLPEAKRLGIRIARLTCYADNIPSARVIEKNGGVRAGESYNDRTGVTRKILLYDIKL